MRDTSAEAFLKLVAGRRGHFRLESGHHGELWLDLDPLFADLPRIQPFVSDLTDAIRPHNPSVVCGPLLGGAFLAQLVARELGVTFCFTERITASSDRGLYQVRYRLPPAFMPRVRNQRVAMVDDVMSAGSALRGTFVELRKHSAMPVVAGALLMLGTTGRDYFIEEDIAVESVASDAYTAWLPEACPMCRGGLPLTDGTGQV